MKKFLKRFVFGLVLGITFVLMLALTPVMFLLMWVFRVPFVIFRALDGICRNFWRAFNAAYVEASNAKKKFEVKEIFGSERVN